VLAGTACALGEKTNFEIDWLVRREKSFVLTAEGPATCKEIPMRVCFLLKVRAEKVEEYKQRHAQVWPEMLDALRETGWHNYSLFLRPDGLLVGYLETSDFKRACAAMKDHPVNARWQSEMSPFFESLTGGAADDNMFPLEEVFHLD
jgi:L-rhamnose mutarotase